MNHRDSSGHALAPSTIRKPLQGRHAVCLLLVMLGGCASMDSWPEMYSRNKWVGRTTDELFSVYGPPGQRRDESDGQVTYYWGNSYVTQHTMPVGSVIQPNAQGRPQNTIYYENQVREHACVLTVTAKDGIITGYEQERSSSGACGAYNWK